MSHELISHSADLRRLRDEGYEVTIRGGHVLIHHVPYLTVNREVRHGTLVSPLTLAGNITTAPGEHTVWFAGEAPCNEAGAVFKMVIGSVHQSLGDGIEVDHQFSSKPLSGSYPNYYEKMVTYANIIGGPARAIDPTATARTFRVIEASEEDSVFHYLDTASSRAGIGAITEKLAVGKVAIVGLGGTGSYVLDLVAKTPIGEIHLFDGDCLLQHNAFRAPGAVALVDLDEQPAKVDYYHRIYSKMRRNIIPHRVFLGAENVDALRGMDFVFMCMDGGSEKRDIIAGLQGFGIPFVDVGMGVLLIDGRLTGLVRVTASTADKNDHVASRVGFGVPDCRDEYDQNIQIADLNALNAALAVVKWKKMVGFYADLEHEHHMVYAIDGNQLTNDDRP